MGLNADIITIGTLTAVSSNGNGSTFDFSGYQAGILHANFSVAGTTFTPVFQISDDGVTFVTCPVGILAAPGAITATGQTFYPFLPNALALPRYCRMAWTTFTGSFTGTFKATMRR
jgi:hypothetical protein